MKTLCANCRTRPAIFFTVKNRKRRANRQHDLCQRCFRAASNQFQAVILLRGAAA